MRNIKISFLLLFALLTLAWLLADTLFPEPLNYFRFRNAFVQYTGILAVGMMSFSMLLAVRPGWLEKSLHGLDKMYRLHKWLGISALIFSIIHWWFAQGTKWMVGWGWLSRPQRSAASEESLPIIEQFIRGQRGLAESMGEWAFYGAVILIALALVKWFPYHLFKKTHKWLAAVYLVLVYHSIILLKFDYWLQPIGWLTAILLLFGAASSVLILLGKTGAKRKAEGVIKSLNRYPGVHVIESEIDVVGKWIGHKPGQFVFIKSRRTEAPHPYTIASAWDPDQGIITLVVKELGDWTSQLKDWLYVGMPIAIEGPYGCFDFNDTKSHQIWVGAGIGITPFIAKMKDLAKNPMQQRIDLFHVTRDTDEAALEKLVTDAKAANVHLHITITPRDGHLTPAQISEAVPEYRSASLWFCGPTNFGRHLRKYFQKHGIAGSDIHQELFELR